MTAIKLNEENNTAESSLSSSQNSTSVDSGVTDAQDKGVTQNTPLDDIDNQHENKKEEIASAEDEKSDEWVDILGSGQLKMKVITKGKPNTRPQPSDICVIDLLGKLDNGTIVENHQSLKFQLSYHEVIQGIELAVPLMDVGEEAIVEVASRFGYGAVGDPPKIPPNVTITYTVKLLESYPEPDLESISYEKRRTLANKKRERGNWWYLRQDSTKAIQCYRKALDILDETIPFYTNEGNKIEHSEEQDREVIEQKLVIYNNLAAAQLMVEAYESALMSVNRVLQCQPNNVKALFRKGKILAAKGQTNEAVEAFRQAYMLEPENSSIKMELAASVRAQQAEKLHEKNLYKKMFGHDKKEEKTPDSSKVSSFKNKLSLNNFI